MVEQEPEPEPEPEEEKVNEKDVEADANVDAAAAAAGAEWCFQDCDSELQIATDKGMLIFPLCPSQEGLNESYTRKARYHWP
jgi:hypothetical protein